MIHFFKLIRWKNLIMIALMQCLIKYALLLPFYASHGVVTTLNGLAFFLLVLATVCIAAGGYIINDIYDIETAALTSVPFAWRLLQLMNHFFLNFLSSIAS